MHTTALLLKETGTLGLLPRQDALQQNDKNKGKNELSSVKNFGRDASPSGLLYDGT